LHIKFISPTFRVLYRFFTSVFKTAEPLLRGQRAGGGVESAIKTIAYHSLSPSFSAMKTQKLAPSPCLSLTKVKVAQMTLIPTRAVTSISGIE
jgi:hypothetical protein